MLSEAQFSLRYGVHKPKPCSCGRAFRLVADFNGSFKWEPSCKCPGNKPSVTLGDTSSRCPNCRMVADLHSNKICHFRVRDKVWYPTDPAVIKEKQILDDLLYSLTTAKLE